MLKSLNINKLYIKSIIEKKTLMGNFYNKINIYQNLEIFKNLLKIFVPFCFNFYKCTFVIR